jgi:hypothetical protein
MGACALGDQVIVALALVRQRAAEMVDAGGKMVSQACWEEFP